MPVSPEKLVGYTKTPEGWKQEGNAPGPPGAPGIFTAIATQAEAEAGVDLTKGMPPKRVAEAIAALGASNRFLKGTTNNPSSALGKNGDIYINTTNQNWYYKQNGAWSFLFTTKGAAGAPGPAGPGWRDGAGAPDDADGVEGEFYLDSSPSGTPGSGDVWKFEGGTYGEDAIFNIGANLPFGYTASTITISTETALEESPVDGSADDVNGLGIEIVNTNNSIGAQIAGYRAGGTKAAKTAILAGQRILSLVARGWNGTAYITNAVFRLYASEDQTPTAQGSEAGLWVTPDGTVANTNATTPTYRFRGSGFFTALKGYLLPEITTPAAPAAGNVLLYARDGSIKMRAAGGDEVDLAAGGGSLPNGGTTGQVLTKNSNTNGDAGWAMLSVGSGLVASNATVKPTQAPILFDLERGARLKAGSSLNVNRELVLLLNEGTKTDLYDISVNRKHGVLSNSIAWVPGTSPYIACADTYYATVSDTGVGDKLRLTGDFTFLAWVRVTGLGNAGGILDKYDTTVGGPLIYTGADNALELYAGDPAVAASWAGGISTMNDGNWHCIVGRVIGTAGTLWVDGVQRASATFTSRASGTLPFYVGAYSAGGSPLPFAGNISFVSVWSRGVSNAEIATLYASQFAGIESVSL